MAKVSKRRLVTAALEARQRALAPYSRFKVGAALLTKTGRIVTGANVESASYGLTDFSVVSLLPGPFLKGPGRPRRRRVGAPQRGAQPLTA